MSIWAKIKGALFEEEEYEEEVQVSDSKKKAKKKKKKVDDEEVKVAKQIDLPEQQLNVKEEADEEFEAEAEAEEDFDDELESFSSRLERNQKYTMDFDEEDFKEEVELSENIEEKMELPSWRDAPGAEVKIASVPYEGIKEKQIFKPTPIISPIYGILDKNYRKEDVVTKRKVRLSTTSSRRPDLDKVREKAYGETLEEEKLMRRSEKLPEPGAPAEPISFEEEMDKGLIDLNKDVAPAVETVTVGDAEEYFDELGLEYNVDYKDESIEKLKQKPRRSDKEEELEEPELEEVKEEIIEEADEEDGDNLFDLIEAMYDDEEN